MRHWRIPSGLLSCMYVPFVASDACCRKTVSPASFRISMGILRRCAAKVVFMMGMYWCARSPETETTSIRLCRPVCASPASSADVGLDDPPVLEYASVALFIYESASVSAPAICVLRVEVMSCSVVEPIRLRSDLRRAFSITAKGRYLFASERLAGWSSSISTSSEADGGGG